jgi:UDP-2,3-diacylglucosamine pyrophosphatase LpxH
MKINALFISDVHLGSRGSNSKHLLEVLKEYEPEYLFIVGDFIDGWLLEKRHYWNQDFTNVIRKILSYSKNGTKVVYITGNHDEFLRNYTPLSYSDNIQIVDEYVWNGYYIVHGDVYDGVVSLKWLGMLGSIGYEVAITIDRFIKKLGYKKSLSKWLKNKVKDAVKFITDFENQLIYQSKKRNCRGVICGHIHTPSDKYIDNIHYLNCGDFVENNTYIIHHNDVFEIKENNKYDKTNKI